MTQLIVNNAGAISFDRDLTVATTTAADRELKWFRKGPIQSVAEVELNPMRRETYQQILGSISAGVLGPYDLTFPKEVVGDTHTGNIAVNLAAFQTGTSINVITSAGSIDA